MLKTNKHKKLFLAVILMGLAAIVQAAGEQEIDINSITQSNPFARFTAAKQQTATAATAASPAVSKPDLFVDTVTLKFLDAGSLKSSIEPMLTTDGKMVSDAKGNSLIICDTNENLARIIAQIRKVDRKPEQIMIEVVLVDVKLNHDTEFGISWDMLTNDLKNTATFRQNLGFSNRLQSTVGSSTIGTDTTDNVANGTAYNTTGTGSDFWLISGDIRNVIHALQEKNNIEILASPRVMVTSGKTASIESVEEIPYQQQSDTSNGGQLTSTQFKNVGVKLNVTATLMDDTSILLDTATEQSAYTGKLLGVPTVDTRRIQSSLLLKDSQILVIGGLRRKETQKQTNQLPILGDLPLIGLAFKATDTIENSSELLVLLSPHIYKGEKPTQEQMNKYNEITQRPLLTIPKDEADEKEKSKKEKAETLSKEKKEKPVSINADKEKTKNTDKQVTDYLDEKGYLKTRVAN